MLEEVCIEFVNLETLDTRCQWKQTQINSLSNIEMVYIVTLTCQASQNPSTKHQKNILKKLKNTNCKKKNIYNMHVYQIDK